MSLEAPELTELPPGPRQPQYAQALQWLSRPQEFMLRQRERFGDVFTFDFITGFPLVVLADPEDVRTVFTGPAEVMHAGEANVVLEPIVGSNSVLLLDEGRHLRERRLLLPPFHGDRMRRYGEIMEEAVEREVSTWREGETMPLIERMQAITLEVIMRAVFGVDSGAEMERLRELLVRMLAQTTDPGRLLAGLFLIITVSVILQVGSFKLTGRRVFRMAPLHHHFEMRGWPEIQIVVRFWIIQGVCIGAGLGIFYAEWVRA